MATKRLDLAGKRFGRLVAIAPNGKDGKRIRWLCLCDCGARQSVRGAHLNDGRVLSCGCLQHELHLERSTTHGMSRTRPHRIWLHMVKRCVNPSTPSWPLYGGRGIRVCDRWRNSFKDFYADMGDPGESLSIDRIDNDGDYEPGNCRWATAKQQANNRRSNRYLDVSGTRKTLTQAACDAGLTPSLVHERLARGDTVERALRPRRPIRKSQWALDHLNATPIGQESTL